MSPQRGHQPNMSNQLRDPGSKRLGVLSFCASVFPKLSPFCASFAHAQYRGRGFLGDGANLATNSLLVVRLFASPPRLPPCRTGARVFILRASSTMISKGRSSDPMIRSGCHVLDDLFQRSDAITRFGDDRHAPYAVIARRGKTWCSGKNRRYGQ